MVLIRFISFCYFACFLSYFHLLHSYLYIINMRKY